MATISKEISIEADADDVWAVIGDFDTGPHRMAPGYVLSTDVDGDCRIVSFASGTVTRERFVAADHANRRIVYSVVDSPNPPVHDNASMQVIPERPGRCRLVWIRDVLPNEFAPAFEESMTQAIEVIKKSLEERSRSVA